VIDGDLHMDGALLDNVPVDVMRRFVNGGKVIAVDVSPPVDMVDNTDLGLGLSGWRMLWSKINPYARQITLPNIVGIVTRATELGSVARRETNQTRVADLYLQPPLGGFKLFEYSRGADISQVGYRYAAERLRTTCVFPRRSDQE
jgi:predicted acylesterase/phospholipase RssA